jgi:ABC-type branched-subunit amino acid transport system substrate-binding protein
MEVKVNLAHSYLLDSSAVKSAVLRSSSPAVSAVLAIVPLTPTPTFSPFSSSTGTMLILVRNADDICRVVIRVCVTDGSTVNFFATSSVETPFSSATRDR